MMTAGLALTRETILAQAAALPAAPQVLAGLCEMLQEVNTGLEEISDQIRLDPALAARVIRVSNSVFFGGGGRIGSVDEAVNRVGFTELLRLVGVATAASLVDRSLSSYAVDAERMRESLLMHALAAEAVANTVDVDVRSAYAGGLLRSIGMMVIDRAVRGRIKPADVFDPQRYAHYPEWEKQRFGISHTEVTAMVMDEWRFPADLVAGVEEHLLLDGRGLDDRFACVLNVAGAIVMEAGMGLPGDRACWGQLPDKLAALGLGENDFELAKEQVQARFLQHRSALY